MKIIESRSELQGWSDRQRAEGHRIALVPTMGALHAGHLSLVKTARERTDRVIVSIFVNPTQFNDPSDFEGYPRVMDDDLAACREAGVDVVWAPAAEELYPQGAASSATWVDVEGLTDPLCGSNRPGHFRGVTTIVTKLFLAARPHVAVFGEKDFQQLAVIRRMTVDLGFGIEIAGGQTVREHDGLALSSRNVRLGRNARRQALVISRSLALAESMVAQGERSHAAILEVVRKQLDEATQASIDYADLRDPESLLPAPESLDGPVLLAIALQFEPDNTDNTDNTDESANVGAAVRLIDNRILNPKE
ncbi:MAG TPA: pantoate--beta-alanine ligase [Myxococcales bacterium]|nr:pantoate--beta-alanine ligase [Myxococcales bacterium]HIK85248.1 pantoate--beta-alanine ligase [Myxococcales bacterium]